MSKYSKLWEYIRDNSPAELTFDEVEKICGTDIDHSFLNYKKELLNYGYKVDKISLKEQTVVLKKRDERGIS